MRKFGGISPRLIPFILAISLGIACLTTGPPLASTPSAVAPKSCCLSHRDTVLRHISDAKGPVTIRQDSHTKHRADVQRLVAVSDAMECVRQLENRQRSALRHNQQDTDNTLAHECREIIHPSTSYCSVPIGMFHWHSTVS